MSGIETVAAVAIAWGSLLAFVGLLAAGVPFWVAGPVAAAPSVAVQMWLLHGIDEGAKEAENAQGGQNA